MFFSKEDILTAVRRLDSKKAEVNDQISIRMIQLCDKPLNKSLYLISLSCMKSGFLQREIANVLLIRKRDFKRKC